MSDAGPSFFRDLLRRRFREFVGGRPEVIVDFEFRQGLFFISVRNIGAKPAINVRVDFAPSFTGLSGTKQVTDLPLFRDLTYLAPARCIETFVDTSVSYFERVQPTRIKMSVGYGDQNGNRFADRFEHNLEIYREIGYVDRSWGRRRKFDP